MALVERQEVFITFFLNIMNMPHCKKVSLSKMRPLSCNVGESPFGTPEACFLKVALLVKETSLPRGRVNMLPPRTHVTHDQLARVPIPRHYTVNSNSINFRLHFILSLMGKLGEIQLYFPCNLTTRRTRHADTVLGAELAPYGCFKGGICPPVEDGHDPPAGRWLRLLKVNSNHLLKHLLFATRSTFKSCRAGCAVAPVQAPLFFQLRMKSLEESQETAWGSEGAILPWKSISRLLYPLRNTCHPNGFCWKTWLPNCFNRVVFKVWSWEQCFFLSPRSLQNCQLLKCEGIQNLQSPSSMTSPAVASSLPLGSRWKPLRWLRRPVAWPPRLISHVASSDVGPWVLSIPWGPLKHHRFSWIFTASAWTLLCFRLPQNKLFFWLTQHNSPLLVIAFQPPWEPIHSSPNLST